jgi:hypothetical protein
LGKSGRAEKSAKTNRRDKVFVGCKDISMVLIAVIPGEFCAILSPDIKKNDSGMAWIGLPL